MIRNSSILLIAIILTSFIISCDSQQSAKDEDGKDSVRTTLVEQEERIVIEMTKENGVYTVPASVNGLKLKFIFDTGASDVCLSLSEAVFMLKNNYLNRDDLIGSTYAQVADGRIAENTSVKIKSIEIGGLEISDVSAQIVHNLDAPLLLGQSAIQKLGKIELSGDSLVIVRKVKKEISNSDKEKESAAKEKKEDTRSAWDKFKDFLGIHNYQADLDSLVVSSYQEYNEENYIKANKYLTEAEKLAKDKNIKNRDWEILYIKGRIAEQLASSVDESWQKRMPLYNEVYSLNTEKKDGIVVKYKKFLSIFALGLSLHYNIDGKVCTNECEELFNQVINELIEIDEYDAYCRTAWYYMDNLNLARKYSQKAIDLKPNEAWAYITMGHIYQFGAKDYDKALGVNISDHNKGYVYRLYALCYNENSYSYVYYMRLAAKYDDIEAINILKKEGCWNNIQRKRLS